MHGANPKRPPVKGDGSLLQIQEIFPTFQGEGPYTGMPAVFIRLGGCNLACAFCDTEFESFADMPLEAVIKEARRVMPHGAVFRRGEGKTVLAVITGGEPLRQNVFPLCERLLQEGFLPQIETNGVLYRPLPEGVSVVCSPKNAGGGYVPVRADLAARVTAYKFLISADDPLYADIPAFALTSGVPVYAQPIDTGDEAKNKANRAAALAVAAKYGVMPALQMHKIFGIA